MTLHLGETAIRMTMTGPSSPWWLPFAIGIPLGCVAGAVVCHVLER